MKRIPVYLTKMELADIIDSLRATDTRNCQYLLIARLEDELESFNPDNVLSPGLEECDDNLEEYYRDSSLDHTSSWNEEEPNEGE